MKELPYFKFYCSEWISGSITLETMAVQGLFINICALYWFKSGNLTTSEINRRVKVKQPDFKRLVDSNLIKIQGESVKISFLDEQITQRFAISERNSKSGSLGGAPKGNKNAEKNNRKQPKTSQLEEEKEQNRIDESSIKHFGSFESSKNYIIINGQIVGSQKYRVNGSDGMREFFLSNQSQVNYPEFVDKFMRAKNGAHFNDFMHVFNTFNKYVTDQFK